MDALTRSMVLAAGVLIATMAIIVGTAVVWLTRSQPIEKPEDGSDRELLQTIAPLTTRATRRENDEATEPAA